MTLLYTEIYDLDTATVAEADAFHAARGNSTWTGTDLLKGEALARAKDYRETLRWREGVFDRSDIGTRAQESAKTAQIVGALRELVTFGVLQPDQTSSDFLVSKEIAGIKKAFSKSAPAGTVFTEIKNIVRPYVLGGINVPLHRG